MVSEKEIKDATDLANKGDLRLLKELAEKGSPAAQIDLGYCYAEDGPE